MSHASVPQLVYLPGDGGVRIAADRWPRSGPAVILLHGGGQTRHAWGETAATLALDGYDVTAVDLRGHGDSSWCPRRDYALDAFVRDLRAVMAFVARPVVLIGASLGGVAALAVAGEGPREAVRALVLVDITHRPPADGAAKIHGFMRARPEGFESLDAAADAVAAYLPHRPRPQDPSGLMKNLRVRGGRLHWHWDPHFPDAALADRVNDPERLPQAARHVEAPTLLIRGSQSEIVGPQDAEELRRLIPGSRIVEITGARHMVAGDQNTVFGRAIREFLLRAAPAASAPGPA